MKVVEKISKFGMEMSERKEAILNYSHDSKPLRKTVAILDKVVRFSYIPSVLTPGAYLTTKIPSLEVAMTITSCIFVGSFAVESILVGQDRKQTKEALDFVGLTLEKAKEKAREMTVGETSPLVRSIFFKASLEEIIRDAKKAKAASAHR